MQSDLKESILMLHRLYHGVILCRCHMIKLTHVLGNRGSQFPNIINTDYRTIQILLFMLHLSVVLHLRRWHYTHLIMCLACLKFYLWQTRLTSGHFNMNAGVKGDDGEQGKTGNVVSRRVPPHRVNVSCLWSLSCGWNELLVPATTIHTHTHATRFSLCQELCHSLSLSNTAVHVQIYTLSRSPEWIQCFLHIDFTWAGHPSIFGNTV